MDHLDVLLVNARDKMGCNGLRNLRDLAQMRQDTLEKRLGASQHKQTVRNILSIYTAWLWEKAYSFPPHELPTIVEKWCKFLWEIGCTRDMALQAWKMVATTSVIIPMGFDAGVGAVHMGINSFIVERFSTVPRNKRKHAALEDDSKREREKMQAARARASSSFSSSKRQKELHFGLKSSTQINSQSMPDGRRESHFSSPRSKDASPYPWLSAVRREREEEASWRGDEFRFDFEPSPRRPSRGSSHWSPDRDVATRRYRRTEKSIPPQLKKQPAAIKVEDRSPKPPARPSIAGAVTESQTMKRQKPGWQINSVQSQLKQQARAPSTMSNSAKYSTVFGNSAWGVYADRSFVPEFGAVASSNFRSSGHSFGSWRDHETGRLSPWEEDELTDSSANKAPAPLRQAGLRTNEPLAELDNQLPLRPSTASSTSGNKPLSHFGVPQGVRKPRYGGTNLPRQTSVSSSSNLLATQQQHQTTSACGRVQAAPFPKMHASPLPQELEILERSNDEKPLVGYHPAVTRFFARRANFRIHHTSRDIALDTWGDFAQLKPLREYWTWEEYDPSNPIVWDMRARMERR